jgi:hypothetical protein
MPGRRPFFYESCCCPALISSTQSPPCTSCGDGHKMLLPLGRRHRQRRTREGFEWLKVGTRAGQELSGDALHHDETRTTRSSNHQVRSMLRLLRLVSHENRNAELSIEELVGVASPGTAICASSAPTTLSNTQVDSESGNMCWDRFMGRGHMRRQRARPWSRTVVDHRDGAARCPAHARGRRIRAEQSCRNSPS